MHCAQAQDPPNGESGTAPEAFAVLFETTNGSFIVEAYREWAPNAADRFFALVQDGYFDGNLFYWIESNGDVRFGLSSRPGRGPQLTWPIPADPPQRLVRQGHLYFRPAGTAYVQEFAGTIGILTAGIDRRLAQQDVAAFGRVVEEIPDPALPAGSGVLQSLDSSHMRSRKLNQFIRAGDAAMKKEYPNLDSIVRVTLLDREVAVPIDEQPPALIEAKRSLPEGSAMVRIYRPGPRGLDPRNFNLHVDGEVRANFRDGTIFETVLPAGRHRFSATTRILQVFAPTPTLGELLNEGEIALDLQPGEIYYVRGRTSGPTGAILALYQVVSEYGAEESANNLPAETKGRQD
jgi:cyclophilin family peptidyl-prolyl cis-trans isomerase